MRIGGIDFLIRLERRPLNRGRVCLHVCIETSAKRYQVLEPDDVGLVCRNHKYYGPSATNQSEHLQYDLTGTREVVEWRRLIDASVSEVINECWNNNLFDNSICWKELKDRAIEYLQTGQSDKAERVPVLNLNEERRAEYEERFFHLRETRARQEETNLEWERENELHRQHAAQRAKFAEEAKENAFALLFSRLTEEERREAKSSGMITVNNELGRFVIPVNNGLVNRYDGLKHVASYCIVFVDPTIPAGDVALMKYILLKKDPEQFIATAVESRMVDPIQYLPHIQRPRRRRRAAV